MLNVKQISIGTAQHPSARSPEADIEFSDLGSSKMLDPGEEEKTKLVDGQDCKTFNSQ